MKLAWILVPIENYKTFWGEQRKCEYELLDDTKELCQILLDMITRRIFRSRTEILHVMRSTTYCQLIQLNTHIHTQEVNTTKH